MERRAGWSCWEGNARRARLLRGTEETRVEGFGGVAVRSHLVGEAVQAVLVAAHHQTLCTRTSPVGYRLGAQLDAVLGTLGVSVE